MQFWRDLGPKNQVTISPLSLLLLRLVAYDGNRLILNNLELRQQFPDAADYPAAPPASPTKPFSVGPSFQQGLPALRPAGQRQRSAGQPGRRHLLQDYAEERSGYHCGDGLRRRALHGFQGPGYSFRLTDLDGNVVRLRGSSLSFVLYLDHV